MVKDGNTNLESPLSRAVQNDDEAIHNYQNC